MKFQIVLIPILLGILVSTCALRVEETGSSDSYPPENPWVN